MLERTNTAWDTAIDLLYDGAIADCARQDMGTDAETVEIVCHDGSILEVVSLIYEGEEVYTVDTYADRESSLDGVLDAQDGGPVAEMSDALECIALDHSV